MDNRELLVFNYGLGVEEAAFFAPKPVGDPSFGQWFSDPDVAQIGDGELSRDGSLLVVGAGGGLDLNNIAIYRLGASAPTASTCGASSEAARAQPGGSPAGRPIPTGARVSSSYRTTGSRSL